MPRIAVVCEYDGTDFVGYQIQDNGRSVQGVLNKAFSELYKTDIKVTGCSRTDSGVHARGHVSSMDVPFVIPAEKIPLAVNPLLPPDLSVREAYYTTEDFNARFDSLGKRYVYRIYQSPVKRPLWDRFMYRVPVMLDVKRMQSAAKVFEGEHDFNAFCAAGGSQTTTVRRLNEVNVRGEGELIEIEVRGEAFLYNMVRIIAGTLLYVGEGKLSEDDVAKSLITGNRTDAGKTLPPHGLTLEEVFYSPEKRL